MNVPRYSLEEQMDGTKMVKADNKVMGFIDGNIFMKRVRGSRHLLRSVPGWAFDVEVLEILDNEGVRSIHITDIETGQTFEAELDVLRDRGQPIRFPKYGPQLILPLSYWTMADPRSAEY
jgi:hypothetical protein